jgi:hypothetical protein
MMARMTNVFSARCLVLLALAAGLVGAVDAQTIRSHTRQAAPEDADVSEAQAIELTLTLVPTAKQTLQTWIRTAGVLDESRQILTGCVYPPDAGLVRQDLRVRAFPPDSKSSIYQARVAGVTQGDDCTEVEAVLSGPVYGEASRYVLEIIVNLGEVLAIPHEAIIERDGRHLVYVQRHPGHFEPQEVDIGRRGELYAEVLLGLDEGDQVVTLGSFFIDADYRQEDHATDNAHQHH